jgi:hypothetical protein
MGARSEGVPKRLADFLSVQKNSYSVHAKVVFGKHFWSRLPALKVLARN